jgi:hypothetical protein
VPRYALGAKRCFLDTAPRSSQPESPAQETGPHREVATLLPHYPIVKDPRWSPTFRRPHSSLSQISNLKSQISNPPPPSSLMNSIPPDSSPPTACKHGVCDELAPLQFNTRGVFFLPILGLLSTLPFRSQIPNLKLKSLRPHSSSPTGLPPLERCLTTRTRWPHEPFPFPRWPHKQPARKGGECWISFISGSQTCFRWGQPTGGYPNPRLRAILYLSVCTPVGTFKPSPPKIRKFLPLPKRGRESSMKARCGSRGERSSEGCPVFYPSVPVRRCRW